MTPELQRIKDAWFAEVVAGYQDKMQVHHRWWDCPVPRMTGQPCHLCQALDLMLEAWRVAHAQTP